MWSLGGARRGGPGSCRVQSTEAASWGTFLIPDLRPWPSMFHSSLIADASSIPPVFKPSNLGAKFFGPMFTYVTRLSNGFVTFLFGTRTLSRMFSHPDAHIPLQKAQLNSEIPHVQDFQGQDSPTRPILYLSSGLCLRHNLYTIKHAEHAVTAQLTERLRLHACV